MSREKKVTTAQVRAVGDILHQFPDKEFAVFNTKDFYRGPQGQRIEVDSCVVIARGDFKRALLEIFDRLGEDFFPQGYQENIENT